MTATLAPSATTRAHAGVSWDEHGLPELPDGATCVGEWQLPDLPALTRARHQLGSRLVGQAVAEPDDVERLLLAFEELASNGVRHGRGTVTVRVLCGPAGWLVDVADGAVDRPPVPAVDRDPSRGGMGLGMVARLCPAHGWSVSGGSKHVWACVPLSA